MAVLIISCQLNVASLLFYVTETLFIFMIFEVFLLRQFLGQVTYNTILEDYFNFKIC